MKAAKVFISYKSDEYAMAEWVRRTFGEGLSSFSGLTELNVDQNQIDSLKGISNCKALKKCSAADNNLSDASEFSKLQQLEYLNLANNASSELRLPVKETRMSLELRENPIKELDLGEEAARYPAGEDWGISSHQ